MSTITKRTFPEIASKTIFNTTSKTIVKPSFREDPVLIIGKQNLYDYYVTSPLQRANLLEEEDAILKRNHSYSY
jgi:hypothetical protein